MLETSHFWSLLGQGVAGCIEAVQLPRDRAFILLIHKNQSGWDWNAVKHYYIVTR